MGDRGSTFAGVSLDGLMQYVDATAMPTIEQDLMALKRSPEEIREFDEKVDQLLGLARERLEALESSEQETNIRKLKETYAIIKNPIKRDVTREQQLLIALYCIKILKHIPQGSKRIGPVSLGVYGARLFSKQQTNLRLPETHVTEAVAAAPAWARRTLRSRTTGPTPEVGSEPAIAPAHDAFNLPGNAAVEPTLVIPLAKLAPRIKLIQERVPARILEAVGRRWLQWLHRPMQPLLLQDALPTNVSIPRGMSLKTPLPILRIRLPRIRRPRTKRVVRSRPLLLTNAPPRLLLANGRATPPISPAPSPRPLHTPPSTPEAILLPNRNRTPPSTPAIPMVYTPPAAAPVAANEWAVPEAAPITMEEFLATVYLLPPSGSTAASPTRSKGTKQKGSTRKRGGPSVRKVSVAAGGLALAMMLGTYREDVEPGAIPLVDVAIPASKALLFAGHALHNAPAYTYRGAPFTYTEMQWPDAEPPSTAVVPAGDVRNWGVGPRMNLRGLSLAEPLAEGAVVRSNQLVPAEEGVGEFASANVLNLNARNAAEARRAAKEARRAATARAVVATRPPRNSINLRGVPLAEPVAEGARVRSNQAAPNRRNAATANVINLNARTIDAQQSALPPMETVMTSMIEGGKAQVSIDPIDPIKRPIPGMILPAGDTLVYFTSVGVPSLGWRGAQYVYYAVELQFDKSTPLQQVAKQIDSIVREKMSDFLSPIRSTKTDTLIINGKKVAITESSKQDPIAKYIS